MVLGRTALTIANISLLVADLKVKFAQNGDRLGLVSNATLSTLHLSSQLLTQVCRSVRVLGLGQFPLPERTPLVTSIIHLDGIFTMVEVGVYLSSC